LVRMLEEHEGGMKGMGKDERVGRLKARGFKKGGKMEGEGCYSNHKMRAKIRGVELVLLKGLVFSFPPPRDQGSE